MPALATPMLIQFVGAATDILFQSRIHRGVLQQLPFDPNSQFQKAVSLCSPFRSKNFSMRMLSGRVIPSPEPISPHRMKQQIFIEHGKVHPAAPAGELQRGAQSKAIEIRGMVGKVDLAAVWHRTRCSRRKYIGILFPIVSHRCTRPPAAFSRRCPRCSNSITRLNNIPFCRSSRTKLNSSSPQRGGFPAAATRTFAPSSSRNVNVAEQLRHNQKYSRHRCWEAHQGSLSSRNRAPFSR